MMSNNRTADGAKARRHATKRARKFATWGTMPHSERRRHTTAGIRDIERGEARRRDIRSKLAAAEVLDAGRKHGYEFPQGSMSGRVSSRDFKPANPPRRGNGRDEAKRIALESGLTYGKGPTTLGESIKTTHPSSIAAFDEPLKVTLPGLKGGLVLHDERKAPPAYDPAREKRAAAARLGHERRKAKLNGPA